MRPRKGGAALSFTLHAVVLFLLLGYRPGQPAQPPATTLEIDFIAPPPPAPRPLELVDPPHQVAPPAPASRPAPTPQREGGSGSSPALDTSPVQMPSFQVQPSAPADAGHGAETGAGEGPGQGSGTGAGEGAGGGKVLLLYHADWIVKPEAKMPEFNPPRARFEHVSGGATLYCRIDRENRARSCRVHEEHPRGYGFGEAALRMSMLFRIRPPILDGNPMHKVWVPIPIFWSNPKPVKRAGG
jgi:protein TonB